VRGVGADGLTGASVNPAAGLGGELSGRAGLSDHLALQLRLRVEEVIPDLQFLLHGSPILDAGGLQLGVALGLEFAAP
jgi:hypothetical protein